MLPRFARRGVRFLTRDLWRIRARRLSRGRGFLLRLLRVVILSGRGFRDDKCQLRASALTFYSLLSIVPAAAMAFGVAKGFGLEKHLTTWIQEDALKSHAKVAEYVINFADNLLSNVRVGLVAGIGVLILFYTVIKVLGQIEKSLNDIWGIKKSRSLGRKLADYVLVMFLGPVLFIISTSLTVVISTQLQNMLGGIEILGSVVSAGLNLLPWAVVWTLFTFVYIFMPNTKVKFNSALIAGVVAGTIYQFVQWGYIHFQVGVAGYGRIYGSFAALPLFLIWLQLSWLVVLFGAEISFAWQNVETYEFEPDCLDVSQRFKRLLSLRVAHLLVKTFEGGDPPLTASRISHKLEIPIRLVNEILFELTGAGVVSETREDEGQEVAYQLARPPEHFTIRYVLDALDRRGTNDIPVAKGPEIRKLSECLRQFGETVENSPGNVALKDI